MLFIDDRHSKTMVQRWFLESNVNKRWVNDDHHCFDLPSIYRWLIVDQRTEQYEIDGYKLNRLFCYDQVSIKDSRKIER